MKRYEYGGLAIRAVILLVVLGLTVSIGFAQRPQGPSLDVEMGFAPGGRSTGDRLSGTIIIRNGGTGEATLDAVAADLPTGVVYVGQALGSDVVKAPEVADASIRWTGPFTLLPGGELKIRYWAVMASRALPLKNTARAVILGEGQVLARADGSLPLPFEPEVAAAQAQPARIETESPSAPTAVQVTKIAEPIFAEPGQGVAYRVVFDNDGGEVTLDRISDQLPAPFRYVGLAVGSDITEEPADPRAQEIVWTGAFRIPAGGSLTLRYWAWVPPETPVTVTPFVNTVIASSGSSTIGPVSAGVMTKEAELSVVKTVSPAEVEAGEPVIYTVTFENLQGTGDGVLDVISDTLPAGFTFLRMMAGSDITQAPVGTTGTIVWNGPFTVPAGSILKLVYEVETASGGELFPTNKVEAAADGGVVGPASAQVRLLMDKSFVFMPMVFGNFALPHFTATKSVSPAEVDEGGTLVYTARFVNQGHMAGVLVTIEDTLPAGFTFLGMESGSDVSNLPSGTTGTIVWNGPYLVAPQDELKLVYRVRAADVGGNYVNEITATTLTGNRPEEAGKAEVYVKPSILFEDHFEEGIDQWTHYLNIARAHEDQWFWDLNQGFTGHAYTHNALQAPRPSKIAGDSLTMYLGEGSENWTNVRIKAKFNLLGGRQAGVWFRGTYEEVETPGQWVTGYYCNARVKANNNTDQMKLWQLRTEEEPGDEEKPQFWYHFTNPLLLQERNLTTPVERWEWHEITIEADGPRIRCYLDDELAIDYVDTEGSIFLNGTIGLYTFGDPEGNAAVIKFDDILVEPLD
ncbi:family 16 glycoside hydrolase [Chloroflexota bacterium]